MCVCVDIYDCVSSSHSTKQIAVSVCASECLSVPCIRVCLYSHTQNFDGNKRTISSHHSIADPLAAWEALRRQKPTIAGMFDLNRVIAHVASGIGSGKEASKGSSNKKHGIEEPEAMRVGLCLLWDVLRGDGVEKLLEEVLSASLLHPYPRQ